MTILAPPAELKDHRILLVNDDGVHARGIELLEELVREFTDDVWIVGPDEEKSGASHSVSLSHPVRVRKIGDKRFAVKGTPTDCVLMAVWEIMAETPPSVVISGINHGENLAEDITYSGTAGPAIEAALLGFRSIAMSQVYPFQLGVPPCFDTARQFAPQVLQQLLSCPWEKGSFVNVNFPAATLEEVTGVRITTQGQRLPGSFRPIPGRDGRSAPFYWIKIAYDIGDPAAETDLAAIRDKAVSVTPLHLDMTAYSFAERLKPLFGDAA
ncbi:MAG: 5'/3'-nucleotidase SurE [Proteobacteria bacterium]|nr:5'/3'-nucleotidase SurE [Pseudomonadota bacterium]